MIHFTRNFSLCLFLSIGFAVAAVQDYQHISPVPGSVMNTCESTIIIREGSIIEPSALAEDLIAIVGSKSGKINGRLLLSSDQKTIIFKPDRRFVEDETIRVDLARGIKTRSGKILPDCRFSFKITPSAGMFRDALPQERNLSKAALVPSDSLPAGLPKITSIIYDSSAIGDGKIFLSCYGQLGLTFKGDPNENAHIMILNNDGTPFYAKNIGPTKGVGLVDFNMQPNGYFTYPKVLNSYSWTGGGEVVHMVMDNSFTVVDSFQMGNGYIAETHDFRLLPNGHALLIGYYLVPVDLSQYIPGAYPNAFIDGGVVQELDSEKNVVFQWRTWDYYDIKRIPWLLVPATNQQIVNVFHLNAVSLDHDGNLLLGTPAMGLKISRQTGEIMWIIGGFMNQFTFKNVSLIEGLGDLGGHTFQRLENGNILVYDNSPFPWQAGASTISAEVVEYRIDEKNKIAELAWKYTPQPIVAGWHAGNAQRLANGNTVISWGGPPSQNRSFVMREVTATGQKVMDIYYESDKVESYRAFRYKMNTGEPNAQVTLSEVAPGNTYTFVRGDSIDTGVRIKINTYLGSGYNELTVKKYDFAPLSPEFVSKAPTVLPRKLFLSNFAISNFDADIRFQIDKWGISDPEHSIVYNREFENRGLFVPMETSYNHVTREVIAKINKFGEFILTVPDLQSMLFPPKPSSPADSANVNQGLPVSFRWNPVGYVNGYALQVATDADFINLVVNEDYITEAIYTLDTVTPNTSYFWRVKSYNDAGESTWSSHYYFKTISPYIQVQAPNGGETWQRGLPYFIRWSTNILEPVILELCQQDTVMSVIDTVANNLIFNWEIDPKLPIGAYKIKVASTKEDSLFDWSDLTFSVIDTVSSDDDTTTSDKKVALHQNYPNPFNLQTLIAFDLPKGEHVKLVVYDLLGRKVQTLIDGFVEAAPTPVVLDGSRLASGIYLYKLTTPSYQRVRKMILIR